MRDVRVGEASRIGATYLHLARVQELRRVGCDAPRPVALHTHDHVVATAVDALRDDAKPVILCDSTTANAAK